MEGSIALARHAEGLALHLLDTSSWQDSPVSDHSYGVYAVSPDYRRLAYTDLASDELIGIDSSASEVFVLPDPEERLSPAMWLTDDLLVVSRKVGREGDDFTPDETLVVDIKSETTITIPSDLPEFDTVMRAPFQWGNLGLNRIALNPSMTRAVYPALDMPYDHLVLWDLDSQREIMRIQQHFTEGGVMISPPAWAPDGNQFLTSAPVRYRLGGEDYVNVDDPNPSLGGFELISVSADGTVRRLTNLTSTGWARELDWGWSPDGEKVGFWVERGLGSEGMRQLAVLDLQSGAVVAFCLAGRGTPIWSPDGDWLAVNVYDGEAAYTGAGVPRAVIVDPETGNWAVVSDRSQVVGWLASAEGE
jgi:Tol biopolymer transport system component